MPSYTPNIRTSKSAGSSIQKNNKKKILAVVAILIAVAGGFLIYRSFASTQEIGTGKYEQKGPIWINKTSSEATSTVTKSMNTTNNWFAPGEKIEGTGKLSGTSALNDIKNARYLTGKNTDGPAKGKLRTFPQVLVCARAETKKGATGKVVEDGGTITIDVQTAKGTTNIARFNLPKGNGRIFCGTYDKISDITDITFSYVPTSGTTMKIQDMSVRPIIQPIQTVK